MSRKLEITQSMIHLFEKCGRAFEFRYLENLKIPPMSALTVGRSVDDGITKNLAQKISSHSDLPKEAVVEATVSSFNKEAPDTNWQGEDPGPLKDLAVKLVSAHHDNIAPLIEPMEVQKKMVLELPNFILGGTADLIETDHTIADSKTAKSAYDPNSILNSLQPAIYSHLYEGASGRKPRGFRFDVLIKPTKTIGVRTQQVEGIVSPQQIEVAIKRAEIVNHAVQLGVFHYAPDNSWYCSAKWCGFFNFCERGGKK